MDFKIGDQVTYIFGNGIYKIIASKDIPYKSQLGRDIVPLNGADFVLSSLKESDEIIPFVHAQKEHLDLL